MLGYFIAAATDNCFCVLGAIGERCDVDVMALMRWHDGVVVGWGRPAEWVAMPTDGTSRDIALLIGCSLLGAMIADQCRPRS